MAAPGTGDNPLVIDRPGDLERATRRVNRPSEAQARADNYKMAHVVVGGLQVTIETPKDHIRRGTDPNGARWHVYMPADYGYVKRTIAHDGGQVDVYLGPDSHRAEDLPVWVIDQRHHHNHQYDEAKCMLGFPNAAIAHRTYLAGFSDGKGQQRIGAVTRLTFDEFKQWLRSGDTKKPLAYRPPSASVKSADGTYGVATTCPCAKCRGLHGRSTSGGHMDPIVTATVTEPKAAGLVTRVIASLIGSATQEQRSTLFKDASVLADTELGKANHLLDMGDDRGRIGIVEDQWSGPPDDHLETVHAHGPGSKVAPGKVPVGPTQQSSGDGAEKMEGEYSRHAPQSGVQSATERLGRDIAAARGAMKSILKAVEAQGQQFAILEASVAKSVDEAALQALVSAAVTKAIAGLDFKSAIKTAARHAVRKAEEERDEEKDEEKEAETEVEKAIIVAKAAEEESEEDDEEESGSGTDVEVVNEIEEEDDDDDNDDDKAKSMQAAKLRLLAKSRVRKARACVQKAAPFLAKPEGAPVVKALRKAAKNHLAKADAYLAASIAVKGGKIGPATKVVQDRIAKAKAGRKGLAAAQSDNQKIWPASTAREVGKGADTSTERADLRKAVEQISKAAAGMGMLTANVQDLFAAISGQKTSVTDDGQRLPPVFALAKAGGDKLAMTEKAINELRDNNDITFEDADRARDAITSARMGLPNDIVQAKVNRLPPKIQEVITRHAA